MHPIIHNDIRVVSLVNVLCTHLEDTLLVYKTSRRPLREFYTLEVELKHVSVLTRGHNLLLSRKFL